MKLKEFLATKHITMEQFRKLELWKQQTYREMHQEANRQEQLEKHFCEMTDDEIEYHNAIDILHEIGVPFDDCGNPLGIGWD